MSVLDPTDLRRPPDLSPESAGFGTVAEKRLSISDTSNSGALQENKQTLVIEKGKFLGQNKNENNNNKREVVAGVLSKLKQNKMHMRKLYN